MSAHRASIRLIVTLAFALGITSASGQSTTTAPGNELRLSNQENKAAADRPKSGDLESQVAAMKAENAAFREGLRKIEEQQKALLELVDRLQRKLDGLSVGNVAQVDPPAATSQAANLPAASPDTASTQVQPVEATDATASPPTDPVPPAAPADPEGPEQR